jgi:hypothetical protein
MTRTEIINSLIQKNNYKNYLEIGIGDGGNFNSIECETKISVDPDPECFQINATFKITSDEFFRDNKQNFDIIFIDGLHTFEQTYIDIKNALNCLNENGIVIAHDTLPPTEHHQRDPESYKIGEPWNGTCWKAVAKLRLEEDNINISTVDTDWGVSIIKTGKNNKFIMDNDYILNYSFFNEYKIDLMNIISIETFKTVYL